MEAAAASQVNTEISSREASRARCITMPTVIGSENTQKSPVSKHPQKTIPIPKGTIFTHTPILRTLFLFC